MKNLIISSLLIYMLNQHEGWAVSGTSRAAVNVALVILIALAIRMIEEAVKEVIHGLKFSEH